MTPSRTPTGHLAAAPRASIGPRHRLRRAVVAAAVSLLAVAAGCSGDDAAGGPDPTTGEDGGGSVTTGAVDAGEVVPARLVIFTAGTDADPDGPGPGLITDAVGVRAFRGRFLADDGEGAEILDDLADDLEDGDGPGDTVYVGGMVSVGCAGPEDAELRVIDGDLRFVPVGFDAGTGEECDRTVTSVALAAVAVGDLPGDVTIGGEPADAPVGPGRIVVFERLERRLRRTAEELRDADATVDFLEEHDVEVDPPGDVAPDVRRFGYVIDGCGADTAEIVTGDGEITAVATGPSAGSCDGSERYLVVADVAVSASGGLEPEV